MALHKREVSPRPNGGAQGRQEPKTVGPGDFARVRLDII